MTFPQNRSVSCGFIFFLFLYSVMGSSPKRDFPARALKRGQHSLLLYIRIIYWILDPGFERWFCCFHARNCWYSAHCCCCCHCWNAACCCRRCTCAQAARFLFFLIMRVTGPMPGKNSMASRKTGTGKIPMSRNPGCPRNMDMVMITKLRKPLIVKTIPTVRNIPAKAYAPRACPGVRNTVNRGCCAIVLHLPVMLL